MKKTRKKQGLWAAAAAFFVLFCTTCKGSVGLGGTVDIDRPTISVESPPMKAVVRNSFTLKGKLKDDIGVTKVTVTISGPGLIEKALIKNASFDNASGTWSVVLNEPQTNRFPLKDGTYTFQIQAVDGTGKEGTVETKFDIDNTPPLLVLNRPSTLVTDKNVDIFGDVFSLEGQVADSSGVSQLSIAAKDQGKEAVISLSNVPPTIRTKVDSFSVPESPFYRALYGDTSDAGEKSFSYKLEIADGAKEYDSPHSDNRKKEGNRTGVYYLYDDMYELLKHYTVEDLYAYLSGKSDIGSAGRAVSSGIPKTLTQLTEFLSEKAVDTSAAYKGSFGLNPSKSPRFNIEGYAPFTLSDISKAPEVYNETPLTIKLTQNLDKVPFRDADTYQFYLIESETYGTYSNDNTFDINTSQLNTEHFITLSPVEKKKQGGTYSINVKITEELKLKYGKTYILQVKGTDSEDNPLGPEQLGYYGFKFVKTGRPTIRITNINGTEGGGSTKQVFIGKNRPITLTTALDNSNIARVTYKLADIAEKSIDLTKGTHTNVIFEANVLSAKPRGVYPLEVRAEDAESGDAIPQNYQIYYDPDPPILMVSVTDKAPNPPEVIGSVSDIVAGVDFSTFTASYTYTGRDTPVPTEEKAAVFKKKTNSWELDPALFTKEGTYTLIFEVKDTLGQAIDPQKVTVTYDKAAPTITEILGLKRADIDNRARHETLSYKFDITGKIAETNEIEWIKCGPKNGMLTELALSTDYVIHHPVTVSSDGTHTYTVSVKDKAGKEDTVDVNICADTTPPVFTTMKIAGQGFKTENTTQFTQPGEVITSSSTVSVKGAFTDDGSGIEKAVARYKESPSDTQLKEVEFTPRFENGTYTIDGSISLPLGTTPVTVTVYDKVHDAASAEEQIKHKQEWTVNITVENSALELKLGTAPLTPSYTKDGAIHVKTSFDITVEGLYSGSGQLPLELTVTKDGAAADLTGFYTPADGIMTTENQITGFKSGSKTETAKKYMVRFNPDTTGHTNDGRYVFTLKSGTVQTEYVVVVDTKKPDITPVYPQNGAPFYPNKAVKASFVDTSGIKNAAVHYIHNGGAKKTIALSPPAYEVKIAADNEQTSAAGQMGEVQEGKYQIWFSAEDNLGQLSNSSHAVVYYDAKPPQLENVTIDGKDSLTVYIKEGISSFKITATAKDENGIKNVRVFAANKQHNIDDQIGALTNPNGDSWTADLQVPIKTIPPKPEEPSKSLPDGLYGIKVKAKDNAGAETEVFRTLVIDREKPAFNVTQLGSTVIADNAFSTFENTFIPDGKLQIVYTTSDSGSGIDYVEYEFTGTDGSLGTKRFEAHSASAAEPASIHVPAAATGLKLACADKAGNKTVHTLGLKVDAADPAIPSITKIGTHNDAPAVIVGNKELKITGEATDTGSGIDKITWSLAGSAGEVSITGNKWELNLTQEQVKEGTLSITAMDKVGKKSPEKTVVFLQDKEAPEAKITNFAPEASQTGEITVKGSVNDKGTAGVDSKATKWMVVKRAVTDTTPPTPITPQTASWKDMSDATVATWEIKDFKLADYVKPTAPGSAKPYESEYAEERNDSSGFFDLPLYILVKDTVGNAKVEKLTILVDPAGNKPVVTIAAPISPKNDDTTKAMSVGGKVSVYGSAAVKIGQVAEVYMQVSTSKDFSSFVPGWDNKKIEGTSNWNTVLNKDSEIDNLITGSDKQVIVYYRLYAKNTASQSNAQGNYTEVQMLKFDKDNPIIENALLYKDSSDTTGSTYQTRSWVTKDDAYLTVDFKDDSGIKKISLSGAITANLEGHSAISAYSTGGVSFTSKGEVSHGNHNYTAKIPIKTLALGSDHGEYSITIEITEGTSTGSNVHRQWANYTFRYDNTKPIGFFGKRITEGSYNFSGKNVPDNIPQEELKAGRFLFVNGKKITINAKTPSGFELSEEVNGSHDWVLFKDARYLNGASAVLSGVAYDEGGSGIKKVTGQITKITNGSQTKTFTVEGSDKIISRIGNFVTWEATVDVSTGADDGEYALTYKVLDGVGNELNVDNSAGEKVYVKNNMLHITKLHLGTDLNISDAVEGEEEVVFLETDTEQDNHTLDYTGKIKASSFTFKSKETSHIRLEYTGGNGAINYVLKKENTQVASGELQANKTIPLGTTEFNQIGDGTVNLTLTLTDTCGWSSTEAITVNVNASDTVYPYAAILPFFWNENKEDKSSLVWGEDEASTSTPKPRIPKGHISHEGKRTSTDGSATVTYSGTPAVSGKVKIQGYAYDERLLTNIKVKAGTLTAEASFNKASGNAWTPGGSDSTGLTLSVEHVRLDQSGHYVKWTAVWDSEKVSVSENVTLEVLADDTVTTNITASTPPNPLSMKSKVKKIEGTGTRSGETKLELAADDTAVTAGQTVKLYSDELSKHYGAYYAQIDSKEGKVLTLSSSIPLDALKYEVYTNTEDNGASPLHTTKVDVVPYITKITTALSKLGGTNDPDLYARTAAGRYPVREGETITIHGFNLQGASYKIGTVSVGIVSGTAPTWTLPITSGTSGASSGKLEVKVSSIEAINNRNDNDKPYNKGAKTANNQGLTDDLWLDVWQFNDKAAQPDRGMITEPVMRINPLNGMIGFAFANGPDFFSMANGNSNSYTKWHRNYDDFGYVDFVYDSEGTSHGVVVGRDINSGQNHGGKFNYLMSKWGIGSLDDKDNYHGRNARRLEAIGQIKNMKGEGGTILDKTRIQHPSLAVAAASESGKPRLYLAYYDGINDQIRFKYGTNDKSSVENFGQFIDQETTESVTSYNQKNVGIVAGEYVYKEKQTDSSYKSIIKDTGNKTGTYLSLGVISGTKADNDVVVLIWFDETSRMLKYTYKTKPQNPNLQLISDPPTGAPEIIPWSTPVDVFDKMNVGEYCKIAVDKAGGIHIAAFDSDTADLKYAYLASYNAASFQTATVDAYGITGTHITLDVAYTAAGTAGKPVPYIGYYSASAGRSKLAYLVDTATGVSGSAQGTDDSGYFTGKWEVSVVPTSSRVQQDNINVGVWKGNTATDYGVIKNSVTGANTSGTESGTVHGNGTANPVLGYAIKQAMNGYIETAQKK